MSTWFRGLRGQLLLIVTIPVIALVIAGYSSYKSFAILRTSAKVISFERLPITATVGEMRAAIQGTSRYLWSAWGNGADPTKRKEALDDLKEQLVAFERSSKTFLALPLSEGARKSFDPVLIHFKTVKEGVVKAIVLAESGSPTEIAQMRDVIAEIRTPSREIAAALAEVDKVVNDLNAKLTSDADAEAVQAQFILAVISITGSVATFVLGLWIASRLARSLAEVTTRVADAGTQVSSGSEQLSSASQQLSAGATEAAASLEETVSSLEELSSMVKLNADNAKEAAALSQSSRQSAEDGDKEIQRLIGSMSEISQSSKRIEEIINVIDDIAFQTNLLALNAAVEAARAGEQGKGFAVVAEAVRNLAQRSSSAAKDITSLIKDSVTKIETGAHIADESGKALKTIVSSVKKVADLNNEIASASQEQSTGISQISRAMNQLDQVTQTNAASAEEVAASAEEMSGQAESLSGLVGDLRSVIEGRREGDARVYPAAAPSAPYARSRATPLSAATPAAKVLKFSNANDTKLSAPSRIDAESVIPFDDDEPKAKIGTTDGF